MGKQPTRGLLLAEGGAAMGTRARLGAPRGDAGASSVEYGLIVFAIAAVITIAVFALGPPVLGLFDTSCQSVHNVIVESGGTASPC